MWCAALLSTLYKNICQGDIYFVVLAILFRGAPGTFAFVWNSIWNKIIFLYEFYGERKAAPLFASNSSPFSLLPLTLPTDRWRKMYPQSVTNNIRSRYLHTVCPLAPCPALVSYLLASPVFTPLSFVCSPSLLRLASSVSPSPFYIIVIVSRDWRRLWLDARAKWVLTITTTINTINLPPFFRRCQLKKAVKF